MKIYTIVNTEGHRGEEPLEVRKFGKCLEVSKILFIFATEKVLTRKNMCRYSISIDDAVMEKVRLSIANGMDEDAWVQQQVEMLFSRIAESVSPKGHSLRLSQRLRGIGHAPQNFDYKKELEERF